MIILGKLFQILYKVLFIISITFIATMFLVRIAFNSLDWYDNGFDRHRVYEAKQYVGGYAEKLPFTRIQISEIASDIISYFNSEEEFLDVKKQNINGEIVNVFNQREIDHMWDVKNLLEFLYRIQEGLIIYVMLVLTIGFFMSGGGYARQIISLINISCYFTISVVLLFGVISSIAFNQLFIIFHQLSFSNDKWILNPLTSNLIRLFPTQFWVESVTLIGMLLILFFISILLSLYIIKWWIYLKQKESENRASKYLSPEN